MGAIFNSILACFVLFLTLVTVKDARVRGDRLFFCFSFFFLIVTLLLLLHSTDLLHFDASFITLLVNEVFDSGFSLAIRVQFSHAMKAREWRSILKRN